jgi:hypothetical protein
MGRAYSRNGEKRTVCKMLMGKPEGKKALGIPRRKWVYNVKNGS